MGPAEAHKSLEYLTGARKAPRTKEDAVRVAATARDQHWSYEEYLAAVLEREVAAHNSSGARLRVKAAHHTGRLDAELAQLGRFRLIIIDEVGYLPFARWGEVFGDATIAAAIIDRIVHHAEVHTLKGSSYRVKTLGTGRLPTPPTESSARDLP